MAIPWCSKDSKDSKVFNVVFKVRTDSADRQGTGGHTSAVVATEAVPVD
ncbi:hypothetical protein ABT381_01720 [Streptomyces sp. NPDC000151]